MMVRKRAKDTLTAVELDRGDVLEFELLAGEAVRIELVSTHAEVLRTTLGKLGVEEEGGRTDYRFVCEMRVNGEKIEMERKVSTQKSFYEPWLMDGLNIWLDAVDDIFEFLTETHG